MAAPEDGSFDEYYDEEDEGDQGAGSGEHLKEINENKAEEYGSQEQSNDDIYAGSPNHIPGLIEDLKNTVGSA